MFQSLQISLLLKNVPAFSYNDLHYASKIFFKTRRHSSRMRSDHAVTRMSSDRVAMRLIVNRMTDRRLWKHYLPLWSVTKRLTKQESSPVGCQPHACQPHVFHNEQVWTCLEGGNSTCTVRSNASWVRVTWDPLLWKQTHATENSTFPLLRCRPVINCQRGTIGIWICSI